MLNKITDPLNDEEHDALKKLASQLIRDVAKISGANSDEVSFAEVVKLTQYFDLTAQMLITHSFTYWLTVCEEDKYLSMAALHQETWRQKIEATIGAAFETNERFPISSN